MTQLNQLDATIIAMEVVATAMAGTDTIATAKAIEYCLWQNLDINSTDISAGLVEFGEEDNIIKVVKIIVFNNVWSPTLKIGLGRGEDSNIMKLGNWLYQLSMTYNLPIEEEDNIDEYIEEE